MKITVKYSVSCVSTEFILTAMISHRNHSDVASKRLQRNIKSSQSGIYQGSNLFQIIVSKYKSCL